MDRPIDRDLAQALGEVPDGAIIAVVTYKNGEPPHAIRFSTMAEAAHVEQAADDENHPRVQDVVFFVKVMG